MEGVAVHLVLYEEDDEEDDVGSRGQQKLIDGRAPLLHEVDAEAGLREQIDEHHERQKDDARDDARELGHDGQAFPVLPVSQPGGP